ncbi:MAG: hypothetical protein C5B56_12185 [Proteobacteria bacterium]|nr:MAG: hypothetical protein C5B56_12185 [Pseudomonadota bacterium]
MPQQIRIVSNTPPTTNEPGKFIPQAASSFYGDNITWFNSDGQQHWPAPNITDKNAWVKQVIPPHSPGNGAITPAPYTTTVSAATNANPAVLTITSPAPNQGDLVNLSYAGSDTGWQAAVNAVPAGSAVTALGGNQYTVAGLNGQGLNPFAGTITINLPYTLNYICAEHPDETGSIRVEVNA